MKKNQVKFQSVFWLFISVVLTITFGASGGDYIQAFYFVAFLMPVAMGTSTIFNVYLVPKFLLAEQYWKFGLYVTYLIILSLYLEMLVIIVSLILLADYQYEQLNPLSTDLLLLTVILYLVVFIDSFVKLVTKLRNQSSTLKDFKSKEERNEQQYLVVTANRKRQQIPLDDLLYVESLADYCKIHTTDRTIITKEKISTLQEKLPDHFVRTHRSFIANLQKVEAFDSESVQLNSTQIPISRTYKKTIIKRLEAPVKMN